MADKEERKNTKQKGKPTTAKKENFRLRRPEELRNLLMERVESLFRYRMQHKSGELKQTHLLKKTRREISQLKTLMHEKELKESK